MGPVIALRLAKLAVGVERGKPVGMLLFLLVSTAVAAISVAAARSHSSREARALVKSYGDEHRRALSAPRPGEVIAALAGAGASAVVGTAFEAYGA